MEPEGLCVEQADGERLQSVILFELLGHLAAIGGGIDDLRLELSGRRFLIFLDQRIEIGLELRQRIGELVVGRDEC